MRFRQLYYLRDNKKMSTRLQKFDPKRLNTPDVKNQTIVIIGKRTEARSSLVKDLLERNTFDSLLISPSGLELCPDFRMHVDWVFLFPDTAMSYRRAQYDQWGKIFTTFEDFCHVLSIMRSSHECLVFDRTEPSGCISASVFWCYV